MNPFLGIVISFVASFLLIAALDFIASYHWRKSSHLHWSERARLLFPASRTSPVNFILLTLCAVLFGWHFSTSYGPALILFALGGFVGGAIGAFPLARRIFPELTARDWIGQSLQGWGSRVLLFGPLFVVGLLMPREWNSQAVAIAIFLPFFISGSGASAISSSSFGSSFLNQFQPRRSRSCKNVSPRRASGLAPYAPCILRSLSLSQYLFVRNFSLPVPF